jgi:hypothetical protein
MQLLSRRRLCRVRLWPATHPFAHACRRARRAEWQQPVSDPQSAPPRAFRHSAPRRCTRRPDRSARCARCVLVFPDLAALGRAQDPRPVEVGYREGGGHGCSASLAKEGRLQHRGSRVNRSLMPRAQVAGGVLLLLWSFSASLFRMQPHPQVRRRSRTRSPAASSVTCTAATCSAACARQPVGALDHVDGRNADNSGGIGRHSRQNA